MLVEYNPFPSMLYIDGVDSGFEHFGARSVGFEHYRSLNSHFLVQIELVVHYIYKHLQYIPGDGFEADPRSVLI